MAPETFSLKENMEKTTVISEFPDGGEYPHERPALKRGLSQHVDGGWAWVALIAGFFIQFIIIGLVLSMGVFYSELVAEFGGDASASRAISWLISASLGANCFFGPIGSVSANRFGYTQTISVGGLLASAGFFITYFSTNFWLVFFSFGVMTGAGLGLSLSPSFGVIAFYFDKRKKFATTFMTLSVGVGLMVFPSLERYLINAYNWRDTSLILSAISLNLIPFSLLFTHRKKSTGSTSSFRDNADLSLFSKVSFYLMMVNFFLMAGYNVLNVCGMRFAVHARGVSETDAAFLFSMQGLTNCLARLSAMAFGCIPWTSSNRARWTILNVFTILGGLALILFGVASDFLQLCIFCAGIGYFVGGRFALLPALQMEIFAAKRFTTSWSYGTFCMGMGTLLLPSIGNWLAVQTSTPEAPFYLAGICVISAAAFTIPLGRCLGVSSELRKVGKQTQELEYPPELI
ncbi:putative Monocarboxylate transporter 12 [Hypsibius exemplaris]|uniref:Monocarboxylate transporter 12 n=1 Tax=Hypsibius exemplaris TaxID=2072580 RepID=A0A1W0WC99_HYPEX|nr:putative Monocarboxylate transporter 12 [Hypsibius exemplaris]